MDIVVNNNPWFQRNIDATGRTGLSPLQKCKIAIRMLAYGAVADQVDEYIRISESSACNSLIHFTNGVINQFVLQYLRKPTPKDLDRLLAIGDERFFPGMVGSVDACTGSGRIFQNHRKANTKVEMGKQPLFLKQLQTVTYGCGTLFLEYQVRTTISMCYIDHLLVDPFEGRAPPVSFEVNESRCEMGYYLTNGIYPKWTTFIQSITQLQTTKASLFAQHQEASRKDVERALGVLQARFAVIRKHSLAWDEEQLVDIISSCIIMHNMIVEDERHTYKHYANTREFMEDRANRSSTSRNVDDDESFKYYTDRIVNIEQYLANNDDVENRQTHLALMQDLMENIWQKFGNVNN